MSSTIDFLHLGVIVTSGSAIAGSTVYMNNGNDQFISLSDDTIIGGEDNDTVLASGNALVFGGGGNLTFANSTGTSTIIGGSGSLVVDAGSFGDGGGSVDAFAGMGNATLKVTSGGGDTLVGGTGDSNISGFYSDLLVGGSGNSVIDCGTDDTVFGGSGDTTMRASGFPDTLVGGAGPTQARLQPSAAFFMGAGPDTVSLFLLILPSYIPDLPASVVGFRAGVDKLFVDNKPVTPVFDSSGRFVTSTFDGIEIEVYAAHGS